MNVPAHMLYLQGKALGFAKMAILSVSWCSQLCLMLKQLRPWLAHSRSFLLLPKSQASTNDSGVCCKAYMGLRLLGVPVSVIASPCFPSQTRSCLSNCHLGRYEFSVKLSCEENCEAKPSRPGNRVPLGRTPLLFEIIKHFKSSSCP